MGSGSHIWRKVMKNKIVKRLLAGTLVLVMVMSTAGCGTTRTTAATETVAETETESGEEKSEEEKLLANTIAAAVGTGSVEGVDKEETVYVFTDASGNTENVKVSNWLRNTEGNEAVNDSTSLTNISNTSSDAAYSASGEEYTWSTGGEDVYYQGETTKQPPVSAGITYYLNGQEISPEEIAGKSGQVTIRIKYENHEKYNDVYVPFTAVTGMTFANEDVKNVTVDNGTVISEGRNTVVLGLGFPGLMESLRGVKEDSKERVKTLGADIKELKSELGDDSGKEEDKTDEIEDRIDDIDIPSTVEINMDASSFKVGMCMTMVFSNFPGSEDDGTWTRLSATSQRPATRSRTVHRNFRTVSGRQMKICRL